MVLIDSPDMTSYQCSGLAGTAIELQSVKVSKSYSPRSRRIHAKQPINCFCLYATQLKMYLKITFAYLWDERILTKHNVFCQNRQAWTVDSRQYIQSPMSFFLSTILHESITTANLGTSLMAGRGRGGVPLSAATAGWRAGQVARDTTAAASGILHSTWICHLCLHGRRSRAA